MGATYEELRSDKALVCHREINCDQGVATIYCVLLSDGFLIDCGSGAHSHRRATVLANLINEGGAERLSRASLAKVDAK